MSQLGVSADFSYADALRALAATTDASFVPEEAHFDDLFERGILKTERDYCDEYRAVLTERGAAVIRGLIAEASKEADDA